MNTNKFFTLFFLVTSITYSQTDTGKLIWEENYSEAKVKVKKEHKKMLLFFTGSDWCGPCKKLTADFFESDEFKKIAKENLVLYEADFPRNKDLVRKEQWETNGRLGREYNIHSFPTIIIFNEKGKKIGRRIGYNMEDPGNYFKFLKKNIRK